MNATDDLRMVENFEQAITEYHKRSSNWATLPAYLHSLKLAVLGAKAELLFRLAESRGDDQPEINTSTHETRGLQHVRADLFDTVTRQLESDRLTPEEARFCLAQGFDCESAFAKRFGEKCRRIIAASPEPSGERDTSIAACEGCEGRGHLGIHGVEGWCGMCDGTGVASLVSITVNGEIHDVNRASLSYGDVVALASEPRLSVTYRDKTGNHGGTLTPLDTILPNEGMIFNVADTSKA